MLESSQCCWFRYTLSSTSSSVQDLTSVTKRTCVFTLLEFLPKSCALIITFIILTVSGQGCHWNWFGEKCKFKCHCKLAQTCGVNGECPDNGPCEMGFFGPGCQYVDVLKLDASESVEHYLIDYDDTTCNPQQDATFVELSLNKSFPFSWFRIHVKEKGNMLNFVTTLNNGTSCSERKFSVSDTVLDVTCDEDILVNKLRIEGAVAPSICTVYINGGRNVALKEPTLQSGNRSDVDITETESSKAVDGDTNRKLEDKHCSQAFVEEDTPIWAIKYEKPQILYSVRIYNADSFKHRLKGFSLETYDKDRKKISVFVDSSTQPLDVYDVIISSRDQVKALIIRQGLMNETNDKILTLCEVETYGDTVCSNDTYGLSCSENCSCKITEICNAITGACAPNCRSGFYGHDCLLRCSDACLHQICEMDSGNCNQCIPGYHGILCNNECDLGLYGPDCMFSCSVGCSGICDRKNGHCSCKAKYAGVQCTECIAGLYGDNCTDTCPTFCEKKMCNKQTGECLSCYGNYGGPLCEDCGAGWYGKKCSEQCPKLCNGNVCDRSTAVCLACFGNYKGPMCEDCKVPFYGRDCGNQCPLHCLDGTCDRITGKCFTCETGYRGQRCQQESTPSGLLLIPLLIVCIIWYHCFRQFGKIESEGTNSQSCRRFTRKKIVYDTHVNEITMENETLVFPQ